ncbi:MAG: AGE family epimerase/isomerase [Bacteroidales bacterium]|nr:AGE family epimerase/isomerase [Bacteroidales bacterium]
MKMQLGSVRNCLLLCFTLLALAGCKSPNRTTPLQGIPVAAIETELNSLLQTWYPRIIDTIHGGYWTNFEYDWTLSSNQDKMLVTQARGLWTASRAARVYPDNPVYKKAADHGYQFLTGSMWDTEHGGFYQYYFSDSSQTVDPSFKLTYGNAFALFALAEYAQINKDPQVLEWVNKAFGWLENYAHDPVGKGYFNITIPENVAEYGFSVQDAVKRAAWGGPDLKDQNTSIHLLEAFTATFQVLPEEPVRARLAEMLDLIRDTMVNPSGYLNLFFSKNWEPVSTKDSSRASILKNIHLDHISFGHNIETAYLLVDASRTLHGDPDQATLEIAKKLIDHTLAYGFDQNYYGLYDKGYTFSPGDKIEIVDSTKTWWAQAEAWHALALFSTLYPKEKAYREAIPKMWSYITQEIIDHQYGGWYNNGLDKSPGNKTRSKAHPWKSCYHDGRALFLVLSYAEKKE